MAESLIQGGLGEFKKNYRRHFSSLAKLAPNKFFIKNFNNISLFQNLKLTSKIIPLFIREQGRIYLLINKLKQQ